MDNGYSTPWGLQGRPWAIVEGNELPQRTRAWASLLETKIGQEWPFWASVPLSEHSDTNTYPTCCHKVKGTFIHEGTLLNFPSFSASVGP